MDPSQQDSDFGSSNIGDYQVKSFKRTNDLKVKKRIAIFRHPIERLLSAWNQMFASKCVNGCGRHNVTTISFHFPNFTTSLFFFSIHRQLLGQQLLERQGQMLRLKILLKDVPLLTNFFNMPQWLRKPIITPKTLGHVQAQQIEPIQSIIGNIFYYFFSMKKTNIFNLKRRPISILCHPCQIKYEFLRRLINIYF